MNRFINKLMRMTGENTFKLLQYFMLVILFGLAFVLPIYGVREQAKESMSNQIEMEAAEQKKGTIVLDAGHGGFDSGMVGASGVTEKELNLIYAQKLEKKLREAGYDVVQTRSTEEGLYDADQENKKAQDMQRRCEVIEKEKPLVTVSIHQNSYPQDASVCGPQVFYYEQSKDGERLAVVLQKHLNGMPNVLKQRVQKGNSTYYILKRSASVAVIVECGFLTNEKEEQMLQDETYQEQVVTAIYNGIEEYLGEINTDIQ